MPRKELLVMGFRHGRTVLKCLRSRKLVAAAGKRLHSGTALPAKAAAAAPGSKSAVQAKQPAAAQRGSRDGPTAPSFAAASVATPAAIARSPRLLGNLLESAAPVARTPQSPSFAASPLWGHCTATQSAAHESKAAARSGAAAAAAGARAPAGRLPAAITRNPLYRLSKLVADSASATAAQAAEPAHKGSQQLNQALASYAKLGEKPTTKVAPKQLSAVAALLRYAKLK